ncbi:phage capsid and scaffold [Streptococcus pneumoniae]|uniref:capsid assembly scaffolding protein Gp46 family protein n=1 Tax=Streptococcus pneumoniae TaxID=1313 RepID=UPI0005EA1FA9|nr:phage capsid and scaffold [Streptococcus pneumoniae]
MSIELLKKLTGEEDTQLLMLLQTRATNLILSETNRTSLTPALSLAKAMLSERDLPVELVNVVDLTNAETVSESITSIQKAWEESVQKGVSERMKGSAPIKNAQTVQQEVTEKWRKDFL